MEPAGAIHALPARLRARSFERECEQLRPLGVAYVMRRFSGSLNEADAEDAVAEVLIRLHHQMAARRLPSNLRAAFFTSVRNAAIDQLRARAVRPTVALEAAADAPADVAPPPDRAESREDAVRLQEALGRMRGNYREAILMRFGAEMTVPEIAEHLRISLPAAKKLILRATAQVKKRLESIEGAEFCPEMRDLARRSLFEKEASGLASEGETEILRAHFEHCGSCRTFLSALHERLHELGSTALLGLAVDHAGGAAIGEPLASWAGTVGEAAQGAVDRVRHLAFKASGAFQPGDAGTASALAGTSQKIAAICTAGAATTCLATGIVGPGIGVTAPPLISSHDAAPAHVREAAPSPVFSSTPPATAAAASSATAEPPAGSGATSNPAAPKSPADANKVKAQAKSPAQQSQAQFGFEGTSPSTSSSTSSSTSPATASSAPVSEPAPAPAPPPPASSSPSGSSSGGAGSGSESFGFGG